ncbi:MAG: hypothetical protein ABF649_00075 [Bacillus sp. (in: firmicutes)]
MPKILSVLLIGLSGYFLLKKRYRILNVILSNRVIRQYLIKFVMNLPGLRNKMIGSVFSGSRSY